MTTPLGQHQAEITRNRAAWARKPLLQQIYKQFYQRIIARIDFHLPGRIVEIGSGIGNLRQHMASAICTDLFPNPWLDLVCDGYELPFQDQRLSHLILFDVFHHLQAPNAFLKEAQRVLQPKGRLLIFEPYISWFSLPVYGCLHHEPVGWNEPIDPAQSPPPRPRDYYAAQGNATRLFFRRELPGFPEGWSILHAEAFASCSYLLSGGFSKPAVYPAGCLPLLERVDNWLSRRPRLFGARCLIALQPAVKVVQSKETQSEDEKFLSDPTGASFPQASSVPLTRRRLQCNRFSAFQVKPQRPSAVMLPSKS